MLALIEGMGRNNDDQIHGPFMSGEEGRVKTAGTSGRDGTTFEYSTRPSGVGWGGLLNEF